MKIYGLTDKADEGDFFHQWLIDNAGRKFSIREVVDALGFRSPAPINSRLNHMERAGKVRLE